MSETTECKKNSETVDLDSKIIWKQFIADLEELIPKQITIYDPEQGYNTLEVQSSWTIRVVKSKIHEQKGSAPDEKCFLYKPPDPDPLEDEKTLDDYDIKHGDRITMFPITKQWERRNWWDPPGSRLSLSFLRRFSSRSVKRNTFCQRRKRSPARDCELPLAENEPSLVTIQDKNLVESLQAENDMMKEEIGLSMDRIKQLQKKNYALQKQVEQQRHGPLHADHVKWMHNELKSQQNKLKAYQQKNGCAIILGVETNRPGSSKDMINLRLFLKSIQYKIISRTNPTAYEIERVCKMTAQDKTLKGYQGITIFLMAHGTSTGKIQGSDGNFVELQRLFDLFSNANSSVWLGKPKIFIINCCRGHQSPQVVDSGVFNFSDPIANDAQEDVLDSRNTFMQDGDVYKAYATTPGRTAKRNIATGAYFIQAFINCAKDNWETVPLLKIMQKVRADLKKDRASVVQEVHTLSYTVVNGKYNTSGLI